MGRSLSGSTSRWTTSCTAASVTSVHGSGRRTACWNRARRSWVGTPIESATQLRSTNRLETTVIGCPPGRGNITARSSSSFLDTAASSSISETPFRATANLPVAARRCSQLLRSGDAWWPAAAEANSVFFIGNPLVSCPSGLPLYRRTAPGILLLAPAMRYTNVDIEEIEGTADGVIDHVFERIRLGVEGGNRRRDDRPHFREGGHASEMAGMERRLPHQQHQPPPLLQGHVGRARQQCCRHAG